MISRREKIATREQVLELAKESVLRDWSYTDADGSHVIGIERMLELWSSLDGQITRVPYNPVDGYRNWIHVYNKEETEYLEFTLHRMQKDRSNGAATPRDPCNEKIITGDIYALLC